MKENFSKPITLKINGDYKKFPSKEKALKVLEQNYDRQFIIDRFNENEFNVDKWDKYDNEIYDTNDKEKNLELVKIFSTKKHLSKQHDSKGRVFCFLDPAKYIEEDTNKYGEVIEGICIITSLFDTYPKLFDYNYKIVADFLDSTKIDKLQDPTKIVKIINRFLDNTFLELVEKPSKTKLQYLINDSINKHIPIVLSTIMENQKWNENDQNIEKGHAIPIYGYNKNNYYIFDNLDSSFRNLSAIQKDIICSYVTKQINRYIDKDDKKLMIEEYKKYHFDNFYSILSNENLSYKERFNKLVCLIEPKVTIRSKKFGRFIKVNKQFLLNAANSFYVITPVEHLPIKDFYLFDYIERLNNIIL